MKNYRDSLTNVEIASLELQFAGLAGVEPQDLHRKRASEIFAIDPAAVTDEQRRFAKTIGFYEMYTDSASRNVGPEKLRGLFDAEATIAAARSQAVNEKRDVQVAPINGVPIMLEYNRQTQTVTHCYYLVYRRGRVDRIRRKYSDMCRDVRDEFLKGGQ